MQEPLRRVSQQQPPHPVFELLRWPIACSRSRPAYLQSSKADGIVSWCPPSLETPLGLASIRWDRTVNSLTIQLVVPPAANAQLISPPGWMLPEGAFEPLGSRPHRLELVASGSLK
jgi:hypothetical protein